MSSIKMDELKEFNPKLFNYLQEDPERILDFKSTILELKDPIPDGTLEAAAAAAEAV